ncbi:hypothetical protein LTR36_000468 [Oleoguttula mirabilis]|uniref:Signal peptide peptidase n=1 Tax=Oleoguttula mirabilis TaxID=1507867 RepID=A0AAV9JYM1_9PEZI|nr:hypothetical protein LTR36_000468 [Oleoguttula mirabilis]
MDLQQLATAASQHFADARPLIPMYLHLIFSALFPIYTGAHASLSRPSSAAKPAKKEKHAEDADDADEEEEVVQKMEGLSPKDAVVFPVTAGIVLAGLYFLIKRYGASLVNLILGWYFSGVGFFSVAKLANDGTNFALSFLLPTYFAHQGKLWRADASKRKAVCHGDTTQTRSAPGPMWSTMLPDSVAALIWSTRAAVRQKYATKAYVHEVFDFKGNLTLVNALSALFGIASVAYANLAAKPWWLTNLQGFAVCYSALQIMSPTTFATGSLILAGLFCYDIWAVFFTPLMVTVAKNLDQPIKLVFPRPDQPNATPGGPPIKSFSMLGLGDIVLPGLMIGLALRFDLYMYYLRKQTKRRSTQHSATGNVEIIEHVEKAPYVSVTGNWGDHFWTSRLPASARPEKLSISFPKPYFTASMVGYVVGMLTTLGVMSVFQHAQPALLYLVPGVLASLWSTAVARGELKEMWEFSEAITGEQLEGDEKNDAEKKESEEKAKGSPSLFGRLWSEIFGGGEEADKKPKQNLKAPSDLADGKPSQPNDKETKGKRPDDDVLVAFSITRYMPRSTASAEESPASGDNTSEKSASADRTSTPDSSMEDAVLVETYDA